MSLFPSVGSTVTKVLTNKSGTTAKVEFDDGTSLLVKYEALVINEGESRIRSESVNYNRPKVSVNRILGGKNLNRPTAVQTEAAKLRSQVQDDAKFKLLAAQAAERSKNRSAQLMKEWEDATGQHDVSAGPVTLNS